MVLGPDVVLLTGNIYTTLITVIDKIVVSISGYYVILHD